MLYLPSVLDQFKQLISEFLAKQLKNKKKKNQEPLWYQAS